MEDYHSKEYWNDRTRRGIEKGDLDNMIFEDVRLGDYRQRVGALLKALVKSEWKVLDICCGFGFHSQWFSKEQYTGIDFSEEMIDLAKQKYPDKNFILGDVMKHAQIGKFDVVFEVNSGRVLLDDDFPRIKELLSEYATKAVIILEVDYMAIWYAKGI